MISLRDTDLERAVRAHVLFGHQSVGENILDGVRSLIGARPLSWRDVRIGRNEDPISKIEAFRRLVQQEGKRGTIAFFKFCYIDFKAGTDVSRVFAEYKATFEQLARERPETVFAHVTVPLTTLPSGAKAWLARCLGSTLWGEAENVSRHAFNELLRREYGGSSLFDLAGIEAGDPLNPQRYVRSGQSIPMLWSAYTYDGCHLNAEGKRVLGTELVRFVAAQACTSHSERQPIYGEP